MHVIPSLAAWALLVSAAGPAPMVNAVPGPVSQSGHAGVGLMVLAQEPRVALRGVRLDARITPARAEVTVSWTLVAAVDRSVELMFGASAHAVERDALGMTAPWEDVVVLVDGAPVKTGGLDEPRAREGTVVLAAPAPQLRGDVRAAWVRTRVALKAGVATVVTLSCTVVPQHDDWRDARGNVEASARSVGIRVKPFRGFAGTAEGVFSADVKVDAPGWQVSGIPAGRDVVGPLGDLPDVVVTLTRAPAGP